MLDVIRTFIQSNFLLSLGCLALLLLYSIWSNKASCILVCNIIYCAAFYALYPNKPVIIFTLVLITIGGRIYGSEYSVNDIIMIVVNALFYSFVYLEICKVIIDTSFSLFHQTLVEIMFYIFAIILAIVIQVVLPLDNSLSHSVNETLRKKEFNGHSSFAGIYVFLITRLMAIIIMIGAVVTNVDAKKTGFGYNLLLFIFISSLMIIGIFNQIKNYIRLKKEIISEKKERNQCIQKLKDEISEIDNEIGAIKEHYDKSQYKEVHNYEFEDVQEDAGKIGEYEVSRELQDINGAKLLQSVILPKIKGGEVIGFNEIDGILLTPNAIDVLEIKNHSSSWKIQNVKDREIYTQNGLPGNNMLNPFYQNDTHIKTLQNFMNHKGLQEYNKNIFNIVIFGSSTREIDVDKSIIHSGNYCYARVPESEIGRMEELRNRKRTIEKSLESYQKYFEYKTERPFNPNQKDSGDSDKGYYTKSGEEAKSFDKDPTFYIQNVFKVQSRATVRYSKEEIEDIYNILLPYQNNSYLKKLQEQYSQVDTKLGFENDISYGTIEKIENDMKAR